MEKNKENTNTVMTFGIVDPDTKRMIPAYDEGASRGKNYVSWGPGNKFPNELQELIQKSPTLSSIINGTVEMIKGKDIKLNEDIHFKNMDLFYWPHLNKEGDTVEDIVENLVRDYMTFGMFAFQVIYSKIDKKFEIYHIPVEFIRLNEDRDLVYFNKKWGKYSSNWCIYDKFDDKNIVDHKSQIYVYTNSGRRQTYGISPQNPCLEDLVSEALSAGYIKNSLQSGLAARYVISLPNAANLTDQQKADMEDGMRAKFCGVENAGQFMLYFNPSEKGLEVMKVDQDNSHENYSTIRKSARENIFIANRATPALFGDPTAATGFNQQEYDSAYQLYEKQIINPIINTVSKAFDTVFGMENSITFTDKDTDTINETTNE